MRISYFLTAMVALFAVGILIDPIHAKIDPETIVGIWLFEEDSKDEVAVDSSGNGHDGAIFGPSELDDGKFGSSLKVSSGNYVRVLHSDELALKTYTVAAWISTEDSGRWISVISKAHDNQTRNYMIYIHIDTGKPAMSIGDKAGNTWRDLGATTVVNDGNWHHVAISFDDDENVGRIFVDGMQEAQYNVTSDIPLSDADLVFASYTHSGGNGYIGLLDEIAIFSVALEEADIKAVMDRGLEAVAKLLAVSSIGKLTTTWANLKVH